MGRIKLIGKLLQVYLPLRVVGWIAPNRDRYRGAQIDAKAYAVGQLANVLRDDDTLPTIEESRLQIAKTARALDRKGPPLARIRDITVSGADGPIRARLYSDHSGSGESPAMVYFHGGGFVQGDLDTHHEVCAKIAKWWGGTVIAVDYRLAPEHPYPAGVNDAISAYLDIVGRAGELGLNPECIGVGGDSAGGCFAAVVAQQVLNTGGPVPQFQVLVYPVTDGHINSVSVNELAQAYILPKVRMLWYRDMYAGGFCDFDQPLFSPLLAKDMSGLPRSYIVTGGFDPLVDDGSGYADKLKAAGVPVVHRHFDGQVHAFINLTKVIPEGTLALKEIAIWLRGICKQ